MADEFKGLNKETAEIAVSIKNSMREIGISTQALDKQLQKSKGYLIDINDEYQNIKQSTSQVTKLQQEAQKSNKATEKAIIEQNKQLSISKTLNIQIDGLYTAALNSTGKTQENLFKQAKNLEAARDNSDKLANIFGNIAEDSSKLDKSTIWFGALSNVIKDIPGLRTFSKPFEKASEAARQQVINNAKIKAGATDIGKIQNSGIAGLTAGFKALGPIISSAFVPLTILTSVVKIFKFFLDAMTAADKRVTNIAKNLSISKESAKDIYQSFINSKSSLDAQLSTTKNINEAFNELADLSNFVNLATTKQIDTQIILTKEIGVSKEAALGFQSALSVSNIEADKGLDIVYDQIAAFARQNKIVANGRKIFEEINKTSKLIQLNFKGNYDSLVKTTLQANKLGLSLDQVDKIANSLLDFEQSISSELEAELLTGKNINLERARLFALNNDIAGLTEEIAKQNITAENFASMNRIQQEAIAKALGMQANELGEALYNQKLIEQTAGNFTKELRARAAEERRLNNLAEERRLIKQAEGIEQGIISGKSLQDAQRSLDIQDKFNNALEQAQEIFSDIVNGGLLEDLVNILTAFVKSVQIKGLGATIIGGIDETAQREADLISASNKTKNISADVIAKKSQNEQNKDIELLLNKKQILEKQLENAPGWFDELNYTLNKFTGFDPLNVNKTITEERKQAAQAQQQLPEVEKLLKELLNAVQSGGNVYLDSNKVGTAMAMGTYKVQ